LEFFHGGDSTSREDGGHEGVEFFCGFVMDFLRASTLAFSSSRYSMMRCC
jgi:hypothetical protein